MFFGKIDTKDATHCILAHSLTTSTKKIRKGKLLTEEDISLLLENGVTTLTVARLDTNDVHEDQAAESIAKAFAGVGVRLGKASTGRVNCYAKHSGLLSIPKDRLLACNAVSESITISTLAENRWVDAGKMIATIKIIPYAVSVYHLNMALEAGCKTSSPIDNHFSDNNHLADHLIVHTTRKRSARLLHTTMHNTKMSLLEKTTQVTHRRLKLRDVDLINVDYCDHDIEALLAKLQELLMISDNDHTLLDSDNQTSKDWLLISGASAISDRQDVIPKAVSMAGGSVVRCGIPVDPGNLLMIGELGSYTVIGIPGCARSPKPNGLDLFLDRLSCNLPISDQWINSLAIGGLKDEIIERPQPRSQTKNQSIPVEEHSKSKMHQVTAILLAAGSSKRFGQDNKLFAELNGSPLINHALKHIVASKLQHLMIVVGYESEKIEKHCRDFLQSLGIENAPQLEFVYNPDFDSGMGSSLKCGISTLLNQSAELDKEVPPALVFLSDMPAVSVNTINTLLHSAKISKMSSNPSTLKAACIPTFNGKRGNPVLLMPELFDLLLDLSGDTGARHILATHPDAVIEVPVPDPGILSDLDTPEQLARISR